ncbi:hypothetical protein HHL17_15330 [Chitinophaga sp. G-6-1-13]|uniref:Uncharacterized protein n=1 Tax=Chitinophaga fulva TaxID=2728842 RepID=A0A848GMH8_9BACT|nr:hypothetical protein [Chitinophaga fulva]NML38579.1 hypothetical protein [Chitinophaga fulva]
MKNQEQRDTRKPWLISDPSLPPILNEARWAVFSLNGINGLIWIIAAICFPTGFKWFFWLGVCSVFVAFYVFKKYVEHIRIMPPRRGENETRQPNIFYLLGINMVIIFMASQYMGEHAVLLVSNALFTFLTVALFGGLMTALFIYINKDIRRNYMDYAVFILFFFMGGLGIATALSHMF